LHKHTQHNNKNNYDFPTKAASLKPDDYKGHYDLGVWAFQRGMYPEAIQELEKAKGQEGPAYYKMLGQAYDRTGDFQKALQNYKEYLRDHLEDKEIAQRADELNKSLAPATAATAVAAQPKSQVAEGLESSFKWFAEKWDNANPCTASVSADPNNGNRTITVQIQAGTKDKAAFSGIGPNALNLNDCKEMLCKIYHTAPGEVRLASAFINSQGEFFESREQKIAPNQWVTYVVPLTGKTFKSAKTDWNFRSELEGKQNISRVLFLVYGQRAADMYVDSIFFR
jgi:tetratricopeptide (TPR) repeat protein